MKFTQNYLTLRERQISHIQLVNANTLGKK